MFRPPPDSVRIWFVFRILKLSLKTIRMQILPVHSARDDLYADVMFAKGLNHEGLVATTEDFGSVPAGTPPTQGPG
jgi:hypothetical protein